MGSAPKVTIFHVEARRCERVAWLMEELELPYELAFKPGDLMGSIALARAAHPMGVAPTVRIDGKVLVESGAILEFIATKFGGGRLWPAVESPDYADHLLWMHYAEGAAAPRIIDDYLLRTIAPEALSPVARTKVGGTARVLGMAEAHLAAQPYFGGGAFTAADIMMHFPVRLAKNWGVDMALYPHIARWFDTVEARPAFRRMLAKAQPNGPPESAGAIAAPLLADTGKAPAAA